MAGFKECLDTCRLRHHTNSDVVEFFRGTFVAIDYVLSQSHWKYLKFIHKIGTDI